MRAIHILILAIFLLPSLSPAAEATSAAAPGLGRMVLGMLVVLAVMAGMAWFAKRVLPKQALANGVIKQVGGLHFGPRERVVVLEVAGRWVVVGLNGSQMTALADLEAPVSTSHVADHMQDLTSAQIQSTQANGSFAQRLQSAMQDSIAKALKSNKP